MTKRALEFEGCEIVEALDSGPITDLYRAVQHPLGRPVLIKALSSSILPSSPFAATLEREARLLAELDHPNILGIHDFVQSAERMWLVLEHVDGWPLERIFEDVQQIEPVAAASIALETARALEHAHSRGIVHRDIKPRNVWIARSGAVKLTNFSIATDERMPTAPELLDGRTSQEVSYISPEQILGEPPNPRSDLFSLGMLLYRMVAGRLPFDERDPGSFTHRLRHEAPPALGHLVPHLPSGLERLTHRCLQKLPNDRFSSAEELARALHAVLHEAGAVSTRATISGMLARSGLAADAHASAAPSLAPTPRTSSPESSALLGIAAGCLLLIAGGGAIHAMAERAEVADAARHGGGPLELVPKNSAYLRIAADPWAHVAVDGQQVATTPFAEPIPLRAGTHYVRLEHPRAPAELRTITMIAGETVLLDVKMQVPFRSPVPKARRQAQGEPPDASFSP